MVLRCFYSHKKPSAAASQPLESSYAPLRVHKSLERFFQSPGRRRRMARSPRCAQNTIATQVNLKESGRRRRSFAFGQKSNRKTHGKIGFSDHLMYFHGSARQPNLEQMVDSKGWGFLILQDHRDWRCRTHQQGAEIEGARSSLMAVVRHLDVEVPRCPSRIGNVFLFCRHHWVAVCWVIEHTHLQSFIGVMSDRGSGQG